MGFLYAAAEPLLTEKLRTKDEGRKTKDLQAKLEGTVAGTVTKTKGLC